MLNSRLLHAIERNCEIIALAAVEKMRADRTLVKIGALTDQTLFIWSKDVPAIVRKWMECTDTDVLAARYNEFGKARFLQEIPLPELISALHIWRECSVSHVRSLGFDQDSMHIYIEEEFEHDMIGLYDFITYNLVRGYEDARAQAQEGRSTVHQARRNHPLNT